MTMHPIRRWLLALALLAAPVAAAAQPGPPPRDPAAGELTPAERREHRPFELLLGNRDHLGLSGEQVARLEGIGERLEARNRPLRQRLRQEHARWAEARRRQLARLTPAQRRDTLRALRQQRRQGEGPGLPPAMRPLVEQMRGNIGAAMREAQGVLTPVQKRRARQLLRQQRHEQRERRWAPGARLPRGGGR